MSAFFLNQVNVLTPSGLSIRCTGFELTKGLSSWNFWLIRRRHRLHFQFQSYDQFASWVIDNLKTQSNDKQQSSLLTLELEGPFDSKAGGLFECFIDELQAYELREKNLMAVNTIDFIDSQLVEIEYDLKQSEAALEQFRAENLIVDLGSEAEQMLEYFIQLEEEKASLNLQRSFYNMCWNSWRTSRIIRTLFRP